MNKPTQKDFLATFAAVTETSAAEISLESRLQDLPGWDSLSMVMFLGTVDAEYGKQLDGGDVARAQTVRDLYNLL